MVQGDANAQGCTALKTSDNGNLLVSGVVSLFVVLWHVLEEFLSGRGVGLETSAIMGLTPQLLRRAARVLRDQRESLSSFRCCVSADSKLT